MGKHAKDFNCSTCPHKHCDNNNPAPYVMWEIPGVIATNTCLKPMVTEQSEQWISLYSHYKNHILPFAGGLLEQPAAYQKAMQIIDSCAN